VGLFSLFLVRSSLLKKNFLKKRGEQHGKTEKDSTD